MTPNEWRPFDDPMQAKSIEQILQEKLLRVGHEKGYKKHIKPRFIELRSLNRAENRSTLRQLREFGSIVILDAISLRHPLIQQEYRHSLLDAFPTTLVASIAPDASFFQLTHRVTIIIEHYIDLEFHRRHDEDEDARCARITNEVDINRLIMNQVEYLLPSDEKPERRRPIWYNDMNTGFPR